MPTYLGSVEVLKTAPSVPSIRRSRADFIYKELCSKIPAAPEELTQQPYSSNKLTTYSGQKRGKVTPEITVR